MGAVQHESLALEGVWRIAAFGATAPHVSSPGNPSSDIRFLVKLRNLEKPQTKVVQMPVGEMPLLYHEAVLIDGRISKEERFQPKLRHGAELLNYAPSNLKIFRRLATEDGELIIPASRNGAPPANDAFNGYFLGIRQGDDPYSLIIPAAEVLRFFYATSDSFTRALFDGSILDPHGNLFYEEKLDEHGTGSMMLRKKVRDADARYLSRFAFSPYAMKQAKNLHLRWAVRNATENHAFVSVIPPIDVEAETAFLYRQIETPGRTRKLITKILSCKCPPPCQRLLTGRETDAKGDRPPADGQSARGAYEGHNDTPPNTLSDQAPTGESSNSIEDPAIDDRFPEFSDVDVIPHSRDQVEDRSGAKARLLPPAPVSTGSVVPGRGSGGPVARTGVSGALRIKKESQSPDKVPKQAADIDASPSELGHTAVLQRLAWMELYTQAAIRYCTVLPDVSTVGTVPVNVYPSTVSGRQKKWLYTDNEKTKRRFAIVAEIKYQERYRYLLELQQIGNQQYSTIVFWSDAEERIDDSDIVDLLTSCAIESKATLVAGGCPHIQWGRIIHSQAPDLETNRDTAHRYLERIVNAQPVSPHGRACNESELLDSL
ncbi:MULTISPECIES: hypothetical protein [Pseudomonas]|uniref:hypothetical protein n=1 Tax=Pseudomonas TaxID=286 RepID=UPI000A9CD25F|nr:MULTISPECIES: hypothetical protein [Pseudomonas]MDA3395720.1 hypothetical protein [Pseudomonas aeruginosa]HCT5749959.1 hypothetical protein [Pseudomonas aeruginosa]